MSKAFTREDDRGDPVMVPARAPLPAGVPNYVTARGLQQLRDELRLLEEERATILQTRDVGEEGEQQRDGEFVGRGDRARRLAFLEGRIAALANRVGSATLVDPPLDGSGDEVRFGMTVTVRPAATTEGARRFTIVGVDEADAAAGRVAFVAPISRALLGRRVGDVVTVRGGRGEEELEIVAIAYHS